MNYYIVRKILGKIMILLSIFMVLPLVVAIIYQESIRNYLAFIIPMVVLLLVGSLLQIGKEKSTKILAREGFVIVGLSWIVMSLFGCLPFIISGDIPYFFDAFFEISSGFTTTGASILTPTALDSLSHSSIFWRSFSHFIGGMGVLVFILAIIPESKDGSSMHILRAESPGPQVGKLVSKMSVSSRILYIIYIALTLVQVLLLWLGPDKNMTLFNSLMYSFGTAGTGGFTPNSLGFSAVGPYSTYVVAIFMILFGINFSMFYLLLLKNVKDVFKNEELRTYLITIILSVTIVFLMVFSSVNKSSSFLTYNTFEESFRHSLFQVASIITTTGFSTAPYESWHPLALTIIIILTFFGACAGSTGGGIKISRIVILFKTLRLKIKSTIFPRKVETIHVDGKTIDLETRLSVVYFILFYFIILIIVSLIISIDGFDLLTNFTASLTCISNVGPGLGKVGPSGNFSMFSPLSKIVLSLEMIFGRLEIFPMLVLFYPKTWIKK